MIRAAEFLNTNEKRGRDLCKGLLEQNQAEQQWPQPRTLMPASGRRLAQLISTGTSLFSFCTTQTIANAHHRYEGCQARQDYLYSTLQTLKQFTVLKLGMKTQISLKKNNQLK